MPRPTTTTTEPALDEDEEEELSEPDDDPGQLVVSDAYSRQYTDQPYYLVWYFKSTGEEGGTIDKGDGEKPEPKVMADGRGLSDWHCWKASRLAAKMGGQTESGTSLDVFRWASKKKASEALRAIKEAFAIGPGAAEEPDWALKAREHGWTPPKGWLGGATPAKAPERTTKAPAKRGRS